MQTKEHFRLAPSDVVALPLEFLLVSNEYATQQILENASDAVSANLKCAELELASDLIKTHKIDAIILDVPIKFALDLVGKMRRTKNSRAFTFVCVNNEAEEAVALKAGANALLRKPLHPDTVSASVRSFQAIITSERRRYRRHWITTPVVVNCNDSTYPSMLENISEGGMAVHLPCLLPESSIVEFSFELDSATVIDGSAQLRWANRYGLAGLEFRNLEPQIKSALIAWLRERSADL